MTDSLRGCIILAFSLQYRTALKGHPTSRIPHGSLLRLSFGLQDSLTSSSAQCCLFPFHFTMLIPKALSDNLLQAIINLRVCFLGDPICNSCWWLFWVAELAIDHWYFVKLVKETWFKLWLVGIDHNALYLPVYSSVFLPRLWCIQKCSLCFMHHYISFQVHNSKWNLGTQQMYVKWTNKIFTYFNAWYLWPCSSTVNLLLQT